MATKVPIIPKYLGALVMVVGCRIAQYCPRVLLEKLLSVIFYALMPILVATGSSLIEQSTNLLIALVAKLFAFDQSSSSMTLTVCVMLVLDMPFAANQGPDRMLFFDRNEVEMVVLEWPI